MLLSCARRLAITLAVACGAASIAASPLRAQAAQSRSAPPLASRDHDSRFPISDSRPSGVERQVPIAVRALPRGATISPADYQVTTAIVRSALRSAAAAESGWVTRRPIAAGEPLVEPAVGPPALVTRGQPVTFIAEQAGIRISLRGTAASSGALGDRVWVRVDAGRRLRGIVTAPGTISADTTSLR